jgi:hypothetical protein
MHAHHCASRHLAADSSSAETKTETTSADRRASSTSATVTTPRDRAHLTSSQASQSRCPARQSIHLLTTHTPKRGARVLRAPQTAITLPWEAAAQTVRSDRPGKPPHRGAVAARPIQCPETSLGFSAGLPDEATVPTVSRDGGVFTVSCHRLSPVVSATSAAPAGR